MSKIIFCAKLQADAEGLPNSVYPGVLGERIFANISQAAWRMWLNHQTILINEYRLSLMDKSARIFLEQEMEKFLFGDHAELPENYQPLA